MWSLRGSLDGLHHLVFLVPDSLRTDGVLAVRVIAIVVQPHRSKRIRQDGAGRRGNDDCYNRHGKKDLTIVDPLLLDVSTDIVFIERLRLDEDSSTDGGLHGSFGDPSESEEHFLLAVELGLTSSDDRTDPPHGDAEEDNED